ECALDATRAMLVVDRHDTYSARNVETPIEDLRAAEACLAAHVPPLQQEYDALPGRLEQARAGPRGGVSAGRPGVRRAGHAGEAGTWGGCGRARRGPGGRRPADVSRGPAVARRSRSPWDWSVDRPEDHASLAVHALSTGRAAPALVGPKGHIRLAATLAGP